LLKIHRPLAKLGFLLGVSACTRVVGGSPRSCASQPWASNWNLLGRRLLAIRIIIIGGAQVITPYLMSQLKKFFVGHDPIVHWFAR